MSPSYSQPSDDLSCISGDRCLYSEKNMSQSYPSNLSSNSTYSTAVHKGSSSINNNARLSSERHTSLSMAPQSVAHELPRRTASSQKLQRIDSSGSELKIDDIGYPGVIGIKNHGNTCYASSVIQCLSNTEYFTEHFVNDCHRARLMSAKQSGRECAVTDGLAQLIESLWTRTYVSKLSRDLLRTVKQNTELFTDSNGHDAEEFLLWLLNTVNDELYGPSKDGKAKQVSFRLCSSFIYS